MVHRIQISNCCSGHLLHGKSQSSPDWRCWMMLLRVFLVYAAAGSECCTGIEWRDENGPYEATAVSYRKRSVQNCLLSGVINIDCRRRLGYTLDDEMERREDQSTQQRRPKQRECKRKERSVVNETRNQTPRPDQGLFKLFPSTR